MYNIIILYCQNAKVYDYIILNDWQYLGAESYFT